LLNARGSATFRVNSVLISNSRVPRTVDANVGARSQILGMIQRSSLQIVGDGREAENRSDDCSGPNLREASPRRMHGPPPRRWSGRSAYRQSLIGAGAVDARHLAAHWPQVAGELTSMMNGVAALEGGESNGRKLEHAEKVEGFGQAIAFQLRELRNSFGVIFVIPLQQVGGSFDGRRHGAIAGSFVLSKRNPVQEETLAGCDVPSELQCAFRRRIWFPATVVGRYSFDHAPGGLVFISDLGEINLIKEKGRLF